MMAHHFLGPYAYDPDDGSLQHVESGMEIASVSRVDDFPCRDTDNDRDFEAELDATGYLLAAAPELLSVVREYARVIEYYASKDERSGDLEGANLKRLTGDNVKRLITRAEGCQ